MVSHRFFEGGDLPACYIIGGKLVVFETDFRAWLKYEHILSSDMPAEEKVTACATRVIAAPAGVNTVDAARAMSWFHSCGDTERLEKVDIPPNIMRTLEARPATSSLFWDFKSLWDSFKTQHDIDLYSCGEMHWWEFKRLLDALKPDTPFRAVQRIRSLTWDDFRPNDDKTAKARARKDWSAVKVDQIFLALPGGEAVEASTDDGGR